MEEFSMSILVLDVGTTSMRGILYDENGIKLSGCQLPNHVHFGNDGTVDESPSDWKDNTIQIMRTIASDKNIDVSEIEAIAITSQR
jgi:glycerol kinase